LYHLNWNAPEQILEHSANEKAMSFEIGEVVFSGDAFYLLGEFALG